MHAVPHCDMAPHPFAHLSLLLPLLCCPWLQITLGREYSRQEVLALSEHYKQWTGGFLAWPW
jgi:hypothetical protein